jgi:hypothetical protein
MFGFKFKFVFALFIFIVLMPRLMNDVWILHILALHKKTKHGDLFQFYYGDLGDIKPYCTSDKDYWLLLLLMTFHKK